MSLAKHYQSWMPVGQGQCFPHFSISRAWDWLGAENMVLLNKKKKSKRMCFFLWCAEATSKFSASCTCCKGVDIIDINKWCSCQSYLLHNFIVRTKILVLTGNRNGQLWSVLFCSLTRQHVVCLGFQGMSPFTVTCLDVGWEVQNELESRGVYSLSSWLCVADSTFLFLWGGPEDKMFSRVGNAKVMRCG